MTEEQKEILIAKMLDAPASLSDMELDAILQDDELRDIYAASSALSSACIAEQKFDMDAEWKRFSPRLRRKPDRMRWFMRVAAIFLGVILASGVVVKIINTTFTHDPQPIIAKAERAVEPAERPTLRVPEQTAESMNNTPVNHAIAHSSKSANTRHIAKAEVCKPTTTAAAALVQIEPEVDVDEYLRIQQARIDNELALQLAESYMEEYDDLVPILDAAGLYSSEMDNEIRKITME